MQIKPLQNFILLKPSKVDEKTETGLYLPENIDRDQMNHGHIVEVGEESQGLKINDHVLYKPYAFEEIEYYKLKYLIGRVDGIMAIIHDN